MYIIIKGMVKEIDASGEILALYHPSDSFDTQALFEQSYRHSFIAVEQSLLYAMPKTIIRTLIEENSEFSAYFFANIADKLKNQSDNRCENELAGLFTAKVHDAYRSYDEFGNFYGCQSISGDETLLKEVRTHLNGYLDSDVGMLMSFARAVNQFDEDGCGFFAQILGQKKHKMDIKKKWEYSLWCMALVHWHSRQKLVRPTLLNASHGYLRWV
ncbi:cyclic nucleotide-binding domain-containing protein [Moraxella catarrhalis]|uniref:cyclic nucleotide-binding domain-containing protein n=1 Tax=Moraxella catarrhalis TaxID=480 RepID=UPI00217F0B3B|nr:cyclic nucleotide-binding domain-containing protein [Moraxella catarrhalis]